MNKSLFLLSCVSGLVCLNLTACKQSTTPSTGGGAPLTATVNGKPWKALITGDRHSQGILDLSGSDDSSTIDIQISPSVIDTGTYPIDDSLVGGVYSLRQKQYVSVKNTGAVHLTTISSTHATGTFNFHASASPSDSVVVTNGEFNFTVY